MNSTQLGIMRAILAEPDCDTPRMVFADACEESGDVERAEFVRCQLELAKWHFTPGLHQKHCRCDGCDLRRREQSLLDANWREWAPSIGGSEVCENLATNRRLAVKFERGFLGLLRCDWATWIAHEKMLFWYAPLCPECDNKPERKAGCQTCKGKGTTGQTVECPKCVGDRVDALDEKCSMCDGAGVIPRPCPDELAATAQPITRLELTSTGRYFQASGSPESTAFSDSPEGPFIRLDRVKCPTCGGRGTIRKEAVHEPVFRIALPGESPTRMNIPRQYDSPCPQCDGVPGNSWTCDAWPGLKIVLPQLTTA